MKALRILGASLLLALGLSAAQGIEIEHAGGTLNLDEPAKRVVALEWTFAEDLLALGVQPVGVADINGYNAWVAVEPALAEDVIDVGTRQEPSLETILALEPDLIIGVEFRHAPILEQLESIAPTLLFNPYPGPDGPGQFEGMENTFRSIAKAVGKEAEAEAELERLYGVFEQARTDLEAQGLSGAEVLLVQAYSVQNTPEMRVFTDNAMAVEILRRIGLENAWPGEYALYGYDTADVEQMVAVSDADAFFYVVQETDDVFAGALANNPLWSNLGFVSDDRMYPLGGAAWLFGGPRSAEVIVEKIVSLLTGQE